MLDLQIAFGAASRATLYAALFAATFLWVAVCLRRGWKTLLFAPFTVLGVLALARSTLTVGINPDAAEHLHCGWMITQGLVPFRDFWQHHSPQFWLLLVPFLGALDPQTTLYPAARGAAIVITLGIAAEGWAIARAAWGDGAHGGTYALVLSSSLVLGNFWVLRPDLPMVLCQLLAIHACLRVAREGRYAAVLAGMLLGLALGFSTKQAFLVFLPPAALWFRGARGVALARGLAAYAAGLVLGGLPLLIYLLSQGLAGDFRTWVMQFNGKSAVIAATFPVAIGLAGAAGLASIPEGLRRRNLSGWILVAAAGLVTLGSVLSVAAAFRYYMQLWVVLAAALAARADGPSLEARFLRGIPAAARSWVAAALLAGGIVLLFAPDLEDLSRPQSRSFREDRAMIARLARLTRGDTCLTFLPDHPVFARDATRLYSGRQYEFVGVDAAVLDDTRAGGVLEVLRDRPPSVIAYDRGGVWMPEALRRRGVLSRGEQEEMARLLRARYVVQRIGPSKFYVRRDKAGAP